MKVQHLIKGIIMGGFMLALSLGYHTWAKETSTAISVNQETSKPAEGSGAVESDVASQGQKELATKRKALVQEAITALSETKKALKALEDSRPKDALTALAEVTGQLEIILSRDPHLAFVPIDVEVTSHDIYADLDAITNAKDRAEEFLENGDVQQARMLLSGLASELVMNTISLPLATYPDAIKAVVPLIDQGKIEEAKEGLQAALQTVVVTNTLVVPLPILRAEALLKQADELAQKMEHPEEKDESMIGEADTANQSQNPAAHKEQILAELENARKQLQMAEALGYGIKKDRYQEFEKNIKTLETKVHGKESTTGVFASLKQSLSQFKQFLFDG
jgi:YfdX protein